VATDGGVGHRAVVVTGVYGTGKTTAIEEMAEILEDAGVPYAAIDLDWLAWANIGEEGHGEAGHRLMIANLAAVAGNQRAAGITHFLLAGKFDAASHLDDVAGALGMPIRVARLVAPIEEIARRLAPNPTDARGGDLEQARRDLESGAGSQLGDLVVDSDRPVGAVAADILGWLGWLA
jgi:hypothetical protein